MVLVDLEEIRAEILASANDHAAVVKQRAVIATREEQVALQPFVEMVQGLSRDAREIQGTSFNISEQKQSANGDIVREVMVARADGEALEYQIVYDAFNRQFALYQIDEFTEGVLGRAGFYDDIFRRIVVPYDQAAALVYELSRGLAAFFR